MASQWWNQFGGNHKSSKKPGASDKFIEVLKQSGGSLSTEKLEKEKNALEQKYREKLLFHIPRIKKEQQEIYSREKRIVEEEIRLLQEEIQALKQGVEQLDRQLEVATEQNIVNPGVYDIHFLQKLINWIKLFRAKIEDAAIWLAAWNQKSKKRGVFWNMVASKKGGAKFLLSSEHYLARSAG